MMGDAPRQGYVHVYTGPGKGKTTAALGLCVRGALSGLRVYVGQFMKGTEYAELAMDRLDFRAVSGGSVTIAQYGSPRLICQGESATDEDRELAAKGLQDITDKLQAGDHHLVVADEILVTLHFGLLATEDILALMDARPGHVELVLTGRGAPDEVIRRAHLVTQMRQVKHYYDDLGVTARKGIEF